MSVSQAQWIIESIRISLFANEKRINEWSKRKKTNTNKKRKDRTWILAVWYGRWKLIKWFGKNVIRIYHLLFGDPQFQLDKSFAKKNDLFPVRWSQTRRQISIKIIDSAIRCSFTLSLKFIYEILMGPIN